ncbi:hypothetical protein [Staphylococcus chromogenes]|uniref:hypothetical protein n=1 Tax=Staphylococcus chromogenes TaxID=46126 RepID=UPI000D19B2F9|nr:hypothetical protein [Staphylococcus chromogenes]PTF57679.1 hypothetical protein BUY04_04955 [Staphylococcus chromogenes]PTF76522.1 hypothetical protein BUY02_08180 [Staphylococcus chromogenes]PTF93511.1 hypothetical protein BU685_01440 [Staphylococcus chromogenes]PTG32015.1 hypothetical protein BU634_09310 [Staphylococcus chromogenes]PUZ11944.1 hypothetical protein BUY06_04780 [Staphylococcus chromogenes]
MTAWTLILTFVVCVLMEHFLHHRFNNKYVGRLCSLLFMLIVMVLFISVTKFEGIKGLAFVTVIFILYAIFEIKNLNLTKEDE